jgi:hypothetical protein
LLALCLSFQEAYATVKLRQSTLPFLVSLFWVAGSWIQHTLLM